MTRQSLPPSVGLVAVVGAALVGCAPGAQEVGPDAGAGPGGKADGVCRILGASYSAWWKTCRVAGASSALEDGEVVFTVDDGVGPHTREMAELLHREGVTATFFPAAHNIGTSRRLEDGAAWMFDSAWPDPAWLTLDRDAVLGELAWIPRLGHTVGNHTYSHPIRDPGTGTPSLAGMRAEVRRTEVVDAHLLTVRALELVDQELGIETSSSLLRFFRSPGNSWDANAPRALVTEPLTGYRGPIAWDLPAHGEEDFRCWAQGLSVAACGERFIRAFHRLPHGRQKAIVLLHEHPKSIELAQYLIDRFRAISAEGTKAGSCIKFAPLACSIGCLRDRLPPRMTTCAHER